jgi:hypothetical protein
VSVTLDHVPGGIEGEAFKRLVKRLEPLGSVTTRYPCTVVSVVGRNLRRGLPGLARAFHLTSGCDVHMLTESSEDLNLSFVVDADVGTRLAVRMHDVFFPEDGDIRSLGDATTTSAGAAAGGSGSGSGSGGGALVGTPPRGGGERARVGSEGSFSDGLPSPFFGPTWSGLSQILAKRLAEEGEAKQATGGSGGGEVEGGEGGEGRSGGGEVQHLSKAKSVDRDLGDLRI